MEILAAPILISFLATCIAIESTPGPNMAYIATLSATKGKKPGFFVVAGVALGLLIIGLLAAFGVAALISNSSIAYESLKWAGVFYLLWLAWDTWKVTRTTETDFNNFIYQIKFFRRGLITNLLNPKAGVFYVSILPKFIDPQGDALAQATMLTLIFVFVATAIHALIVLAASTIQNYLKDDEIRNKFEKGSAVILVFIAIWFALSI